jgi:hypothetical protein
MPSPDPDVALAAGRRATKLPMLGFSSAHSAAHSSSMDAGRRKEKERLNKSKSSGLDLNKNQPKSKSVSDLAGRRP